MWIQFLFLQLQPNIKHIVIIWRDLLTSAVKFTMAYSIFPRCFPFLPLLMLSFRSLILQWGEKWQDNVLEQARHALVDGFQCNEWRLYASHSHQINSENRESWSTGLMETTGPVNAPSNGPDTQIHRKTHAHRTKVSRNQAQINLTTLCHPYHLKTQRKRWTFKIAEYAKATAQGKYWAY